MHATDEKVITNARIVLANRVVNGAVVIRGGMIAAIEEGHRGGGQDAEGDYLIPGLVELHTDHVETHFNPRPGVRWSPALAVQSHDAQITTSGITTVFDALCIGADENRLTGKEVRDLVTAIQAGQEAGHLRASHFTHLRCEVSAPDVLDNLAPFEQERSLRIVSLMDHTPGQRQFVSLDKHREYYQGRTGMTDAEYADFVAARQALANRYSDRHRKTIAAFCRERDIVVASHDDATEAHVGEAVRDGVRIAEFPTTVAAARASHQGGMKVLMGAPNLVRGGSHSGNVSAKELACAGFLDVLSSDYVPFSLIQAAFLLPDIAEGVGLVDAIALVTKEPADAVGLADRGEIAIGRRADLVRVHHADHGPVVRTVWKMGERIA